MHTMKTTTLLWTSRSRLASGFYRDGRCNHAGRWAKASAAKIAAGAGSAGNHSRGSFRCAASEASRFRAASASRSAPSRAMVRSAERRSFRLCFDDACLDDACFASVIFQRPFSYRFNGYTAESGGFGAAGGGGSSGNMPFIRAWYSVGKACHNGRERRPRRRGSTLFLMYS